MIQNQKKIPVSNNKFYIYSSNNSKNKINFLFNIKNGKIIFDKDVIVSILELSNYSDLWNFISKDKDLPKNILDIFYKNIINNFITAKGIYQQYIEYKNKKIIPKKYNNKLKFFKTFNKKGFFINKNIKIENYKLLKKQILSDIIYQNIYLKINNQKVIKIFENGKLIENLNYKINNFNNDNYIFVDFKEIQPILEE